MRSDAVRPKRGRTFLALGLVGVLLATWVVWWQWEAIRGLFDGGPVGPSATATGAAPAPAPEGETADAAAVEPTEREQAERRWAEVMGREASWPEDLAAPEDCEQVEADLSRICALLDAREYIRASATPTGACGLLRQVAEELAARPPSIAGELRNYETLVANVFHVYRTLGRQRTELLRRIVVEEQQLTEPAAMALFRWAISRQRCAGARSTPLTLQSLYAHSGFLFNTLGGQAYLRRRSPRIEALFGFYALVVIDRAQATGYDPAGVDPRPEIERVRALLANEPLVFRDHYLLVLDQMAARWKQKSQPPVDRRPDRS